MHKKRLFGQLAATAALLSTVLILAVPSGSSEPLNNSARKGPSLAPVSEFGSIRETGARSAALFAEIAKAAKHPRCMNCHTLTDRPFQGDDRRPHVPRVTRGYGDIGVAGMYCTTCHQAENYEGVPGHGTWLMAPQSMGWTGMSDREICEQWKDRSRNGDRSPAEILHHIEEEHLLGFAWTPPDHLEPAPGSRHELAALVKAWAETGAHCPTN